MFFRRDRAFELLRTIQKHVNPGGHAVVNVLINGTTHLAMFDAQNYYLFSSDELEEEFAGWKILASQRHTFVVPEGTCKEFLTVIAKKPGLSL